MDNTKYIIIAECSDGNEGTNTNVMGIYHSIEEANAVVNMLNAQVKKESDIFNDNHIKYIELFDGCGNLPNNYPIKEDGFILGDPFMYYIGAESYYSVVSVNNKIIENIISKINNK